MSRAHPPQELAGQWARSNQLVNEELDLSPRERALLNVILRWSLKRGREWAEFGGFAHLGGLAEMARTHAAAGVAKLAREGLLQRTSSYGVIRCRFLPSGVFVEPPLQTDPKVFAALVAQAELLNSLPEGFDPDGQRQLALQTVEESVDHDLARLSRERAGMSGAGGPSGRPDEDSKHSTESVISAHPTVPIRYCVEPSNSTESVPSQTRARPRARHDHEETTSLNDHDHEADDRGGAKGEGARRAPVRWRRDLRPLEFELFESLEAAMQERGEAMVPHFERTWCEYISTHPAAARDAIGDAIRTANEGKCRKTLGGLARRLYLDFSGLLPYHPPAKK